MIRFLAILLALAIACLADVTRKFSPPPGGTGIDWTNSITNGLVGAYIFDRNFPLVLLDSTHVAGNLTLAGTCGTLVPFLRDPVHGDAGRFGTSVICSRYFENLTYNLPNADSTVLQIVLTDNNLAASVFGNIDSSSVSVAKFQSHNPFSGTVYFDFGGASGNNRVSYTPAAGYFGTWHTVIYTAGSTGMAIITDGAISASNGVAVTRTNTASGFAIGGAFNTGDSFSDNCSIALHLLWTRILTATEIARMNANPYQIFLSVRQARSPRIVLAPNPPTAVKHKVIVR